MRSGNDDAANMTAQAALWAMAGGAAAAAAGATVAERRRAGRRDLDAVGWIPWAPIQVVACIASVVAAALALRA